MDITTGRILEIHSGNVIEALEYVCGAIERFESRGMGCDAAERVKAQLEAMLAASAR